MPGCGVSCVKPLYSVASVDGHFLLSSVMHQIILTLWDCCTPICRQVVGDSCCQQSLFTLEHVFLCNTCIQYLSYKNCCKYREGFVMCLPIMIAIYKYVKGFQAKGGVLHRKKTWQNTRVEKKNR